VSSEQSRSATFEEYQAALRATVRSALEAHSGSAIVTEGGHCTDASIWGIEVEPQRAGAACVSIVYTGSDEVTVGFGQTHAYLWAADPAALAMLVGRMLSAIFAGHVVEAGRKGDSFARITLPDGEVLPVGAAHLPLPWELRRKRGYRPYSGEM